MPPRSLAHLKREITEEKPAEARRWARGRTSKGKCGLPKTHTVAGSSKRVCLEVLPGEDLTGHCLSGQYLQWTKNRPTTSAGGAGARHSAI